MVVSQVKVVSILLLINPLLESSNTQESIIIAKMVDKFSNPVKPGTAVYFSKIGSIQGSKTQSDENGEAEVKLCVSSNLL